MYRLNYSLLLTKLKFSRKINWLIIKLKAFNRIARIFFDQENNEINNYWRSIDKYIFSSTSHRQSDKSAQGGQIYSQSQHGSCLADFLLIYLSSILPFLTLLNTSVFIIYKYNIQPTELYVSCTFIINSLQTQYSRPHNVQS